MHVMHVNCAVVKNLTLRVDEKTLDEARRVAAERSTSVNELVRCFLSDLANQGTRREQARRELLALCQASGARVGAERWTRDSLHER